MMLIKNATIFTQDGVKKRDVLLKDGKIVLIEELIAPRESVKTIDAQGLYLLPGLIDLNVRFANSILNKEHIDKLAQSAIRGGVTTSVIMPDFTPRLDNATLLELLRYKIDDSRVDLKISAPLADDKDDTLNNIATLVNNGAVAIWAKSNRNANLIKRGMQYGVMKNRPIFCSCYEPNLDDNGVMNEGEVSSKLGLPGISCVSETSEVAKVSEIAMAYKAKIVFQSLSTQRSIEILKENKKTLSNFFAEVSIHHLCKNDTQCDGFNTYAKIMPPLRDEKNRKALLEELVSGNIDTLTSAHSPRSILYKDVAFEDAEFGIGSIEEFLGVAYTYLVKSNIIDMPHLMRLCSTNPAKILALATKGEVKEGFDADIVLFDPNESRVIENKNSLYYKDEIFGKVKKVLVGGEILFEC
ncbi:MAG: amidohydrolase family protein [Sulfurospirillaceae bacterium]|nr:amidohydrolase family protein [Sulfurospirillaceae bacterium]